MSRVFCFFKVGEVFIGKKNCRSSCNWFLEQEYMQTMEFYRFLFSRIYEAVGAYKAGILV